MFLLLSLLTRSSYVYKTNFCALFIFKIVYVKHIMSAYPSFLPQKTSHLTRYMTFGFVIFPEASWENQNIDFWMKRVLIICVIICTENKRQEKKIYIPLPQSMHLDCLYCNYMYLALCLHSPMFQNVETFRCIPMGQWSHWF